jgi:4-hydroxybenzoate polyprenyltransferase
MKMLRPQQWIKNLFLFAGLIFSRSYHQAANNRTTIFAFLAFCLLASGIYIINDLIDYREDKHHPVKSRRPIASDRISRPAAVILAVVLIFVSLLWSFFINHPFLITGLVYLAMMLAYSIKAKEIIILDVLFVAGGYVLRAVAGALAIRVDISPWLLLCTFLLALFLVLSKRRTEIVVLGADAVRHRKTLGQYSLDYLNQMIAVVTSACIVAYCLYTLAPETVAKFHSHRLIFTVPFVIYGIFRYLYLTYKQVQTDQPERAIIADLPTLICLILWVGVCIAIISKA